MYEYEIGYILLDLSNETIKFKILISVENTDEKTAENDRNCYAAENPMISKIPKISI